MSENLARLAYAKVLDATANSAAQALNRVSCPVGGTAALGTALFPIQQAPAVMLRCFLTDAANEAAQFDVIYWPYGQAPGLLVARLTVTAGALAMTHDPVVSPLTAIATLYEADTCAAAAATTLVNPSVISLADRHCLIVLPTLECELLQVRLQDKSTCSRLIVCAKACGDEFTWSAP